MPFRTRARGTDDAATGLWDDGTGPAAYYEGERLVLPARVRPPDDVLTQAAERAPILRQVRALCEFLGDGRALTEKGNLRLADAAALATLAETGDEVEPRLTDPEWKLRSATELRHLDMLLRWARHANAIRTVKGRLVPTATFRNLAHDPVAALDQLVDDLFAVGPVVMARPEVYPAEVPLVSFVDTSVKTLLTVAYEHLQPIDVGTTITRLAGHFLEVARPPAWTRPEHVDEDIARYLDDALRGLQAGGVVRREGAVEHAKPGGWKVVTGGRLVLTQYGIATVQRQASRWRVDAPVLARFNGTSGPSAVLAYRSLAELLDRSGPGALHHAFDQLGDTRMALVRDAWDTDDPAVLPVLDALATTHPDRATAKAARKAATRHRSKVANPGG